MARRIVVCTLGGERNPWELPASTLVDRKWVHGGERTLYGLALAAASTGADVELRGELVQHELEEMCESAGVRPRTGLPPRRPTEEDLVVVPEGWPDPIAYARVALSPARAVLMVLGPPGLFGWPFVAGWSPPDPLTVSPEAVGRPEHLLAIAASGFELWTNNLHHRDAAAEVGVECTFVGVGSPEGFPDPGERVHDAAVLVANRWLPLARRVASRLEGLRLVEIPVVSHRELLERLGRVHVLPWPCRIEGMSRTQIEARAMGVVPVGLSSNRFSVGLQPAQGGLVVDHIDDMPSAVMDLLSDRATLAELSASAIESGRSYLNWDAHVRLMGEALARPAPADAARDARAAFAERVVEAEARGRVREEELERRLEMLGRELDDALIRRDAAVSDLDRLRARRSVRLATAFARLARPAFAFRQRRGGETR